MCLCFYFSCSLEEVRTTLPALLQEADGERLNNQTTAKPRGVQRNPYLKASVPSYCLQHSFSGKGCLLSQKVLSTLSNDQVSFTRRLRHTNQVYKLF